MRSAEEERAYAHTDARPIFGIYEQLLAMKLAAEVVGLSASADARYQPNAALLETAGKIDGLIIASQQRWHFMGT